MLIYFAKKAIRFSLFELIGDKMKHGLYLFIAATLFSKNQQSIHRLIVFCQNKLLFRKKYLFV